MACTRRQPTRKTRASLAAAPDRHAWLIRLRWLAILGVAFTATLTASHGWIHSPAPFFWIAGLMAIANLLLGMVDRLPALHDPEQQQRGDDQILALQICLDLCMLTMLLHWSGSIENPFAIFFVFHMSIGAISFPLRRALLFGLLAVVLFGGTVLLEAASVIPHYPLMLGSEHGGSQVWHSAIYVTGYLVAFSLALFGTIAFVSKIETRRRLAEKKAHAREMVALSRERLARLGELSAGVAHSIRNPLHGALNCLALLKPSLEDEEDGSSQKDLDLLGEGLQRIENVTQRLLTFSGQQVLKRVPTDLNKLIRDSVQFIDPRLTRSQVTMRLDLEDIPQVTLDPDKVSETLINLMDNAVFACHEDGQVTVRTRRTDSERVQVEVMDTGIGIHEKDLRSVFDPLFTNKEVGQGSGMGLAIARRVVEEHEGEIAIESAPGEYTAVRILLPVTPSFTTTELS